jgi:hypothetical protein
VSSTSPVVSSVRVTTASTRLPRRMCSGSPMRACCASCKKSSRAEMWSMPPGPARVRSGPCGRCRCRRSTSPSASSARRRTARCHPTTPSTTVASGRSGSDRCDGTVGAALTHHSLLLACLCALLGGCPTRGAACHWLTLLCTTRAPLRSHTRQPYTRQSHTRQSHR